MMNKISRLSVICTVETRNLDVPGTCKHNSRHPEIDPTESGFLHVIVSIVYVVTLHNTKLRLYLYCSNVNIGLKQKKTNVLLLIYCFIYYIFIL